MSDRGDCDRLIRQSEYSIVGGEQGGPPGITGVSALQSLWKAG